MKWFSFIDKLAEKIPDFPLRLYSLDERTVKKADTFTVYFSFVVFYIPIIPIIWEQDTVTKIVVGSVFFVIATVGRLLFLNKPTNFAENGLESNMQIAILWIYVALSFWISTFLCMGLSLLGLINFEIS